MGDTIQLTSARDGFRFDAYHAGVTDARRGGLVILHAIWGVTPHLRELADSYAEGGYEVIVPSLFDRFHRGFPDQDLDKALHARQDACARAVDWGAGVLDLVQAAIDALRPPVFAMGFCFGGTTAWLAAARCHGLSAVASFYGGQIVDHLDAAPQVPIWLHLGKHDPYVPLDDVEKIRAAHPDVPVYMYDAGHAFVAPSGFHADSARLSHLRVLQMFARHGGGRSSA